MCARAHVSALSCVRVYVSTHVCVFVCTLCIRFSACASVYSVYVMWWALEKHNVPIKYITLIKDMYKDATTFVRTCDGDTTKFPINIGLHQRSAWNPYLFALVMDDVTRGI